MYFCGAVQFNGSYRSSVGVGARGRPDGSSLAFNEAVFPEFGVIASPDVTMVLFVSAIVVTFQPRLKLTMSRCDARDGQPQKENGKKGCGAFILYHLAVRMVPGLT